MKNIQLCLEHNIEVLKAAERIRQSLAEAGYPDVELELSIWKDWNEDIKAMRGVEAIPAEVKPPPEMVEARMFQMA